ncbi:MAG: hypothetical protein LC105_10610 [Chitinophagales bacterium]|nr:hypothetical protein [Chitinophagales bacterium]MCZ2394300.1 hypothetical protein [Chitinophagales bacterium]
MRITVVAASKMEIAPLLQHFDMKWVSNQWNQNLWTSDNHLLHVLITGIGMMQTASHLAIYAMNFDRDIYINAGVAGAFDKSLHISEVVQVISERYGDFGVEEGGTFKEFIEMGFIEDDRSSENHEIIVPSLLLKSPHLGHLREVKGLTVNKVHTNPKTIGILKRKFNADIESMEGIAFFNVLNILNKRCIQIRSISNYVGNNNEDEWSLTEAIESLNMGIQKIIPLLQKY